MGKRIALGMAFLCFAGWATGQLIGKPDVAAVVNDEPIPMADVDYVLRMRQPLQARATDAELRDLRRDITEMLVDDLLLQQFLRQHGPKVEPGQVDKKFHQLQESLKAQGRTMAEFYKETGQSEAQLKTNILNMIQWAGYVKQRYTDEEVRKYFDDHRPFFDRELVRASHIVMRTTSQTTPEEIEALKAKLLTIRQEIADGKIAFADAAKKYSQCPSAGNGGDVGEFPRKWAVDEVFAKTAFALDKGSVSEVIQSSYGLHILHVTDRKAGQPADFDKIKEEVREVAAEDLRQSILAEQRATARIDIRLPAP